MKNVNKILLFFLIGTIISCSNDDDSPEDSKEFLPLANEELLGEYFIRSVLTVDGDDADFKNCTLDNSFTFDMGSYQVSSGVIKCEEGEESILLDAKYFINPGRQSIEIYDLEDTSNSDMLIEYTDVVLYRDKATGEQLLEYNEVDEFEDQTYHFILVKD